MISLLTYPVARVLGDEAALTLLAENGFSGIDYSMHTYPLDSALYALPEQEQARYFQALRERMEGLGLAACQLHTHYPT